MRLSRRSVACALAVLAAASTSLAAAGQAVAKPPSDPPPLAEPALPVVFVHGFSGSAQQYETQAMRWASNDYPNVVTAIDRISASPSVIYPILDQFFDDVMAQTGDSQIYALGHSQGTAVMGGYLNSSPERAARVAKYIGIDGATGATCPGGVTCMGVWARGSAARVLGDNNARFPEQGHTEVVGSAESFAAQYEFFTGVAPRTTMVLPEPPGQVEIAGRALNFPFNTGLAGATVDVFQVDAATGARTTIDPLYSVVVADNGNLGPWKVNGQQRYEIQVTRQADDGPRYQHFYFEPFIRDDFLIRLNLSPIGSPLSQAIERGPHGVVSMVRQKEWWDSNTVDPNNVDSLQITTTQGGVVTEVDNVANPSTLPYTGSTIAAILFDVGADQASDTTAPANLGPFLTGIDVYMPGTDPTDGVVTFTHGQRRAGTQVINTPNWSSEAGHAMTVTFRDWVQHVDSWGECKRAKPSPCH